MIVFLDREGAKTPLPDMAAGMVVLVVTPHVRRQQPHHVVTQFAISPWPDKEVEMIRHEAVAEQAHIEALPRLPQELEEGIEIAILVKDSKAAVATVEDVITVAALGRPCTARHAAHYRCWSARSQAKSTLSPFSCPRGGSDHLHWFAPP